jgi:hypothetical protein
MNDTTLTQLERCQRVGCRATATHSVKLLFARKGDRRDTKNRFALSCSLKLCGAHAHSAKAKDIITDDLKNMISSATLSLGAQDDFDYTNVLVQPVPLDSSEWVAFEATGRKKN